MQQSDLVVVDIDIGEHIFQHRRDDIASLEKIAYSCRTLSDDDVLFIVWPAAIKSFVISLMKRRKGFIMERNYYSLS